METLKKRIILLIAEDDPDDRKIIEDALNDLKITIPLSYVNNGEELMDYLGARSKNGRMSRAPLPDLILLDLNMPGKDGREALKEIKSNDAFRGIPVIVFTASGGREDVNLCYKLGANSYIKKPLDRAALIGALKSLKDYWLEMVKLPDRP